MGSATCGSRGRCGSLKFDLELVLFKQQGEHVPSYILKGHRAHPGRVGAVNLLIEARATPACFFLLLSRTTQLIHSISCSKPHHVQTSVDGRLKL